MKIDIKSGKTTLQEALLSIHDKSFQTEIYLEDNGIYDIKETLILPGNISIYGNNAKIHCHSEPGILITGSRVILKDITLFAGKSVVRIDSKGTAAEDISFENCRIQGYSTCGLWAGSSSDFGICSNLLLQNCEFQSANKPEDAKKHFPTAQDIILCAASAETDVHNARLNKVKIIGCQIMGASICNIFMVPGICEKREKAPDFNNCSISDVLIENCILHGSFDTAVAAQANYINNNNCWTENVTVKNNDIEVGITGISATAGSPMHGKCKDIIFRNLICDGNYVKGRPGAGEPQTAICADAGLINYYSDVQCSNSRVVNVSICGNTVENVENGIMLRGAFAMIDAEKEGILKENCVENIVIRNNELRDVDVCFLFFGAYLEGRRFDWKWGLNRTEQKWLEHPDDNSIPTMSAEGNYIRNLSCEKNHCRGFRYLLKAAGAAGRGHGCIKDNRLADGIVFKGNIAEQGENHIHVADCILEDWVNDLGGNCVDMKLKNI